MTQTTISGTGRSSRTEHQLQEISHDVEQVLICGKFQLRVFSLIMFGEIIEVKTRIDTGGFLAFKAFLLVVEFTLVTLQVRGVEEVSITEHARVRGPVLGGLVCLQVQR